PLAPAGIALALVGGSRDAGNTHSSSPFVWLVIIQSIGYALGIGDALGSRHGVGPQHDASAHSHKGRWSRLVRLGFLSRRFVVHKKVSRFSLRVGGQGTF